MNNFIKNLEETNYVVNYNFISGEDFKNNILFLIEALTKPILLIIERNDINSKIKEIINDYNIKYIITENSKNINRNDKYDKFYLNY
jgi:hypothetical protein